jgi:hypothetical protein
MPVGRESGVSDHQLIAGPETDTPLPGDVEIADGEINGSFRTCRNFNAKRRSEGEIRF